MFKIARAAAAHDKLSSASVLMRHRLQLWKLNTRTVRLREIYAPLVTQNLGVHNFNICQTCHIGLNEPLCSHIAQCIVRDSPAQSQVFRLGISESEVLRLSLAKTFLNVRTKFGACQRLPVKGDKSLVNRTFLPFKFQ